MISLVDVVFFFFFKQKTAYEMRISDWSSDVCSSDLGRAEPLCHRLRIHVLGCDGVHHLGPAKGVEGPVDGCRGTLDGIALAPGIAHQEIGRASCRERVCQYV